MSMIRAFALVIVLLASPFVWRFGLEIYDDWNTIDITDELTKHRFGKFKPLIDGDRFCILPAQSLVVPIMLAALPGYKSNRFRSPPSDSRLWYLVSIDDHARSFSIYTVDDRRAPLVLNPLGMIIGQEDYFCPCSRDLQYEIRNTNARQGVVVHGATEDLCDGA